MQTVPVHTEAKEVGKRRVTYAEEMPEEGLKEDAIGEVFQRIGRAPTKIASIYPLEPVLCTPTVEPGINQSRKQKGGEGGAVGI